MPGHVTPSVTRVEPTAAVAATRAISGDDTPNSSGGQPLEYPGPLPERKRQAVADGTVDDLETRIVTANKHLQQSGTAISLRLHVDEEGVLHFEIADHRATNAPIVQRVRVIEQDEITRLINDLLGEVGICLDETA